EGKGGEHARRIVERNHYREIYHTPEVCAEEDLSQLKAMRERLGGLIVAEEPAKKSWYKSGDTDIPVYSRVQTRPVQPLSKYSSVMANMQQNNQVLLYIDKDSRADAEKKMRAKE
ncbi:MAG: hypothetical protein ACRDF4_06660, partial [Rhabdochlamydiaceae bacterium]